MLDTQPISLTPDQSDAVRRTILDTIGKPVYRTLNPHNVATRFGDTVQQLQRIIDNEPNFANVNISLLGRLVKNPDRSWHPACTLKRLRQFEAIARIGRCELTQRGHDPDILVSIQIVQLSLRLRLHHSTFL